MPPKVFDFIGKRILLFREVPKEELKFLLEENPRDQETTTLLKTGLEKMEGIFLRGDPMNKVLSGGKGEIDFIQPLYNAEKKLSLSIYFGINHRGLQYLGRKEGLESFQGSEFLFPNFVKFIFATNMKKEDVRLYNSYLPSLKKARFKVE